MDDRSLVAALVDGAPHGLAGVYDAYADRLFAYAVTLLRDRDAAPVRPADGGFPLLPLLGALAGLALGAGLLVLLLLRRRREADAYR